MTAQEIEEYLEKPNRQLDTQVQSELLELKEMAVNAGDEYTANYLWCLQQIFKIQKSYLAAFYDMKHGRFEEAWNMLDRTDIELSFLETHFEKYFRCPVGHRFYLGFILNAVKKFQKLFPYKLFTSREDIIREEKCSICGRKISLRSGCKHRLGELYMGEMCGHEITDMEFLNVAIVRDPFDKYAILKIEGQEHNYTILEQLMRVLTDPFAFWNVDIQRIFSPDFKDISRNDLCPCGSGKKYKKCCHGTDKVYTDCYCFSFASQEYGVIQPLILYNTIKK